MKCVSALSTLTNTEAAIQEVVERAAALMGGEPGDLALVFASPHHAAGMAKLTEAIRAHQLGRHVLGCTGESIVADGQEIEGAAALGLWSARLPDVDLKPFRLTFVDGEFSGMPTAGGSSLLLLGDPFSFPADQFLLRANGELPGLRVVGGMASGANAPGQNRLILDGETFQDGAVAISLEGALVLRTIVSQGCRPIGRPYIVTKAEQNLIRELGRRPALEVLGELFATLPPGDQHRVQHGLHVGRVINEYQESFQRGDFLVHNVLGADEVGGIAISDRAKVGQTVQFHVRDEETADEDLRALLEKDRDLHPDANVRGALLFTCNGRGTRLFSEPHHDVTVLQNVFNAIPTAGFFAMGELGPVGGQNFVHGYTASIVLFEEPGSPSA
ncbi:Small ligand-binding sensory domain FIST [Singulisphaera sp. GP187]|uniref:FIST signal transduction protein n=1 Tax=Singulisphaera sp. GP187 TaxID=1882752 RepID=UPI00092962CF|nr:FIST N-terminal domain-containing protein [Singulisphaera sp. GP187]SIO67461.1 Small ligand-binding sensory domain FIST [Singulisphaera sp. GP187]